MNKRMCIVVGCPEAYVAKGYCGRHYAQVVVKKQEPTERKRWLTRFNEDGLRLCSQCSQYLPLTSFYKFQHSKDGLESQCRDCKRDKGPLYRHKVTGPRHEAKLQAQGGTCPCGEDGRLVVDHDHACCPGEYGCADCFRGLLCNRCNVALGMCNDDSARMRKLADYLDAWKVQNEVDVLKGLPC